ncbi:MAG: thiamine phosphate synthase [Verrucomicrobia bacterium]|nr:thiamine phosphate synthase [Verrucomicrobiota bacterium]
MNNHDERIERFKKAGLYLVTSQALSEGRSTVDIVRHALVAGAKLIQLREKDLPLRQLLELARDVRALTEPYGCLLIINDRIDVALAVGADGVHLGLEDLPIESARAIGPELIIGSSSHTIEEAREAEADGASYVNVGPIYPTKTKNWTDAYLGIEGLKKISECVSIPFTVMGGIKRAHIPELRSAGARTIALVTAVTAAPSPEKAVRELLEDITCQAS